MSFVRRIWRIQGFYRCDICPWNLAPINRETTLDESIPSEFDFLSIQHPIPILGAVDFGILICNKNHTFRRYATLVIRHAQRLTISPLRLLDGHTYRHTDVDMQLLPGRILQVQQGTVPDRIPAVQLTSTIQSSNHHIFVIHIDSSLEEERRWVSIILCPAVLKKAVVVGAAEGQLSLDPLLRLGERRLIGIIHAANGFLATNLQHHLVQPRQSDGLIILRERLAAHAALIAPSESIKCN